jgi:hypothetical protein
VFELAVPGYESPWRIAAASLGPEKFDAAALLAADAPPQPAATQSTAKMLYTAGLANPGLRAALRSVSLRGRGGEG